MWSEARSVIREGLWRKEIGAQQADRARRAVDACPVLAHTSTELGEQAWTLAIELGWAKTYDAEYVALAKILNCRLVTLDLRLWRGTRHLGFVVTPEELKPRRPPSPDQNPSAPPEDQAGEPDEMDRPAET
jgi:predicted nucleic acid-binding protein